ncbi:MAG TPA: ABC transporter substrate-binding protein, partial [Candidatus Nanopelagicaceae bacterium]
MKIKLLASVATGAAIALTLAAVAPSNAASGTILIGGIAGTTGAYGSTGQAVVNASQMAVDEINAAGGVLGKKLVFKWHDDGASATTSAQLFNQYLSAGAVAIIGSPDTGPTTAALSSTKKIPVLGAVDDGGLTIYPNGPQKPPFPWAWSTSLNTLAWGGAIGKYAAATCKGLAVLHDPSSYGMGGLAGIQTAYAAAGKKLALNDAITENWSTGATVALKSEITKIQATGADCVDVWLTPQDQAAFMQVSNSVKAKFTFFGNDETDADPTFSSLAKADGNGMISALLTTEVHPTAKLKAFQKKYKARFKVASTPFAELSYDAIGILAQAINAGKSTAAKSLQTQLNKIKNFPGLTGSLSFTKQQHTTINA